MDVLLISQNKELYRLCSEVVEELFGHATKFGAGAPDPFCKADIYIWDFHPDMVFPENLGQGPKQKHFFVVQRRQMAAFREKAPSPDVNLLLKPVTRATLKACLGQVKLPENGSADPQLRSVRADRDEMLQCLIQANLKLQEYDQDRTNFLARALHDFRAPLTALCGYCGLLLGEQLGPLVEEQKEVLQRMQYSAKRLSRMASAMFQLSIGQRVDNRPNFQKNDIRECIDQALHEMTSFADEKRLSISIELHPPMESLFFERSQGEQVLINILDNACKFTPKSGFVEISGYPFFWERRRHAMNGSGKTLDRRITHSRAPNSFRVDIRDSGPGIPAEHLDRIFEEYTSYSGGHDRSGGGLGLAICKLILNRHQGRIWAETSSEGAIFSFVLPYQLTEMPSRSDSNGFENALCVGAI